MGGWWHRWRYGLRKVRCRDDWPELVGPDWLEWIMAVAVTDRFHAKQGRSTGRWVVEAKAGRQSVYLKRHYRLGWWRGLLAACWPRRSWSPGLQEWEHLEWARQAGIPVPAALAAGELLGPWGQLQSFLAVAELSGMVPLHEAIPQAAARLDPPTFACWKRGLVYEMARLTRELHSHRRFHKDLYLCHFFAPHDDAPPADWRGRLHLIDLHRLGHHPWTWPLWQAKDLAQLLYSSEVAGVTPRDRLRFWRAYRQGRRRSLLVRWLEGWIAWKWRRYRRHNTRRSVSSPGGTEPSA
ncbi:MAG: hypothetical protein NZ700_00735 [Gemmataceae bacterium]|nr:hypothetical protein [Gemmataceae bacterium]MDW8266201.1 lipopolysaccharide kinase InaA family protein [Gemmataceae bacterium]